MLYLSPDQDECTNGFSGAILNTQETSALFSSLFLSTAVQLAELLQPHAHASKVQRFELNARRETKRNCQTASPNVQHFAVNN